MKNILMIMLGVGLSLSAFAGGPRVVSGGGARHGGASRVVVVSPYAYRGYGFGYNPFYSPYFGVNSLYYSPFGIQQQPSKLDLDIQQIDNDYHQQVSDVRHDKSLSRDERKQKIRDLRHEKENSIIDAKKDYYKSNDSDDTIE